MKPIMKYNVYKGVSTLLTVGTPIITLACCSSFFVSRSDTAISAAGMFAILIALLFFKDKIMEKFKTPSALMLSVIVLVFIIVAEKILLPMKYVCIATIITSTVDELTCKRFYRTLEATFPKEIELCKHIGFLFTTSKHLEELV